VLLHGVPNGNTRSSAPHVINVFRNRPLSFPPIPTDTTCVEEFSALNCGGWSEYCAVEKFDVVAPEQLTSESDRPSADAVRCE